MVNPIKALPGPFQPGDFWRIIDPDDGLGEWRFYGPLVGFGIGNLVNHTVREHEDGTISVLPGDGSSNSIIVTGSHGKQWHGYIRGGVFTDG